MDWIEVFGLFVVAHLAGDYLLQTEWQATTKRLGFVSNPEARRALLAHAGSYMLAFVPVLIALLDDLGAGVLLVAALIAGPHAAQDEGRMIAAWMRVVKHTDVRANPSVAAVVDQTFHLLALLLVALLVGS